MPHRISFAILVGNIYIYIYEFYFVLYGYLYQNKNNNIDSDLSSKHLPTIQILTLYLLFHAYAIQFTHFFAVHCQFILV